MTKEILKIAIDREFIIARVFLPKAVFDTYAEVSVPNGYTMMCVMGEETRVFASQINRSTVSVEKMQPDKRFFFKPRNDEIIGLYWCKTEADVTIPVGFLDKAEGKGYSFVAKGRMVVEDFLENFPYIYWQESHEKFGTVEYLTEYFVNDKGKPSGFSLRMRDMILDKCKGNWKNMCKEQRLPQKVIDDFIGYGVKLDAEILCVCKDTQIALSPKGVTV